MIHAPEYIEKMHILKPLFRKWKPLHALHFDDICDYVAWFWNRGTISYVIDDWGKAKGVCLIKLFSFLQQMDLPLIHEPTGHFCMIVLMVADGPETMGWLCEDLTQRWGPQHVVMWDRGERTEDKEPRMYRWDQFQKLARRITWAEVNLSQK
jgi:hypothetical protein